VIDLWSIVLDDEYIAPSYVIYIERVGTSVGNWTGQVQARYASCQMGSYQKSLKTFGPCYASPKFKNSGLA
jgi:hypothetical protein